MDRDGTLARLYAVARRQGITLIGAAMIAAGLVWAAVAWAATEVEIVGPSGDETVDIATLDQDVKNKDYTIDGDRMDISGVSLQNALSSIDIDEDEWARITIGSESVTNGEKFVNRRKPVFVLEDDDDVFFVIPKREGEDWLDAFRGELDFELVGAIEIDPDEVDPKQGDEQKFEATVVDGGQQNQYDFFWEASTGETGTDRDFKITFQTAGEVDITVEATRGDGFEAEGSISTKVDESDDDGSGGDDDGSGGGNTGPTYNSGGGYTGPGYTPNFGNSGNGGGPQVPSDQSNQPDPNEEPTIETESGITVDGELLSVPLTAPGVESAPTGSEAEAAEAQELVDEAKEVSAPGALIAGGIIVGLLGLGAGREVETKRSPRFLRRLDLSSLRRLSPPWK